MVCLALFAPDKDLLNVKGGVDSVTGRGNLATLNLGMTGVKLTSRHYEVFVTLIAWTTTANGNIIKTSKSMEMKLHEPGIEAMDEQLGTALIKP